MLGRQLNPTFGKQRGIALFVALIMLLLLSLIGVVGMQVAGLQERMAANYRLSNLAFQQAESAVHQQEASLLAQMNAGALNNYAMHHTADCSTAFDAAEWVRSQTAAGTNVRFIGTCIVGGASAAMGKHPVNEAANPVFQITAIALDSDTESAVAALDVIYIP